MDRVLIPYTKPVGVWGVGVFGIFSQTGCRHTGAAFRQSNNQSNPVDVRSLCGKTLRLGQKQCRKKKERVVK